MLQRVVAAVVAHVTRLRQRAAPRALHVYMHNVEAGDEGGEEVLEHALSSRQPVHLAGERVARRAELHEVLLKTVCLEVGAVPSRRERMPQPLDGVA